MANKKNQQKKAKEQDKVKEQEKAKEQASQADSQPSKAKVAPDADKAQDTKQDTTAKNKSQKKANSSTEKKLPIPANVEQAPSQQKHNKRATRLATLAIVIAVIFSGGAGVALQRSNAQISQLEAQIQQTQTQLKQQIATSESEVEKRTLEAYNKFDSVLKEQDRTIESLQLALADTQGRSSNEWLLAEAEHLVKLATRKLTLEKDIPTAIKLMESADRGIAELNDPSLMKLRQVINDDIIQLRNIPTYDKDGVVLQITGLQKVVDSLPLANAIVPEAEQEASSPTVSSDIGDWKQNIKTSLQNFSEQFITYRVRDGSAVPLLSPEQHFYLRENIKAKLESAIKGVYNEQGELYSQSLQTALEWSRIYFSQDEHKVLTFNQTIEKLLQQNVVVEYPAELASQAQIEKVVRTRLRNQVSNKSQEESL